MKKISMDFNETINFLDNVLRVDENFDLIAREMTIGDRNAKMYFVERCSQHKGGESLACLKNRKVLLSKELHQTYKKTTTTFRTFKIFLFICLFLVAACGI